MIAGSSCVPIELPLVIIEKFRVHMASEVIDSRTPDGGIGATEALLEKRDPLGRRILRGWVDEAC